MGELRDGALESAQECLACGWWPIPIPLGEKNPALKDWPNLRLSTETLAHHFNGAPQNVGVLCGTLADVDLDCPEALAVASEFLPTTDRIHGRPSKPRSHWWYERPVARETIEYKDVNGVMLVELRGLGRQTVIPPSTHPSGERVAWERRGHPAAIEADVLERAVSHVAVVALLARHWPPLGGRHNFALAVGGFLLHGGCDQGLAVRLIQAAARIAGTEGHRERARDVADTAKRMAEGIAVTGAPTLAGLIPHGPALVQKIRAWLGLRVPRPRSSRRRMRSAASSTTCSRGTGARTTPASSCGAARRSR